MIPEPGEQNLVHLLSSLFPKLSPGVTPVDITSIFNMTPVPSKFLLLETHLTNGKTLYSVTAEDDVADWIIGTLVEGEDYTVIRNLKGVWFDLTEKAVMMVKLKWS